MKAKEKKKNKTKGEFGESVSIRVLAFKHPVDNNVKYKIYISKYNVIVNILY